MKKIISGIILWMLFAGNPAAAQNEWAYDTLNIGGVRQVIAQKGISDGPVILFLHGGPGGSRMREADVFTETLQKKFMVVQWDQRESGKTLQLNRSSSPITLDLMVRDTHEMIVALLKRFNKQKLYLAGESWGTVLSFAVAGQYPELLHACLVFGPVTDQKKSEQMLLKKLVLDAKEKKNKAAEEELSRVKIPFEHYEDIYYLRKWWFSYDGQPIADKDTSLIKDYLKDWAKVWFGTWQEVMTLKMKEKLPVINCPVYFFVGGKDFQTNCELARDYYEHLRAPEKKLFWFENAGHSLLITEAPRVQKYILEEILR